MTIADLLADQLDGTRDWTLKLLADLADDDWTFQPGAGLAHALWLCGHLAVSQHVLVHVRCLRAGVLADDFVKHFAIGGPVPAARQHAYPPADEIRRIMDEVHAKTLTVVRTMDTRLLAEPALAADGRSPHPHYRDKLGVITHCNRHEAFHAGQLATIRRLRGKPFLR